TVEEEGVIDEHQSDLLQSSIAFQDTSVEEIMTPRIDMTAINLSDDQEKMLATIHASVHSRIPLYEDTIDNIVGVLILNHFYRATVGEALDEKDADIRALMIAPCFIHKTMKLPAAIQLLREKETHIGIVIDEFGGTLGIVTMEDILEELVGDIWDEYDTIVDEIRKTGENTYEVLGEMTISNFFDEIDFSPRNFTCEYSTMAGWAIEALDANPHVGDHFSYENLYLVVTEMDDLVVTKLTALVNPVSDDDEALAD
ncbi:MAG: CBS domain-containing protein, partial [Clostridia bacterium]|nr:CBS domain-containing protein [Clostridia bacterium]